MRIGIVVHLREAADLDLVAHGQSLAAIVHDITSTPQLARPKFPKVAMNFRGHVCTAFQTSTVRVT